MKKLLLTTVCPSDESLVFGGTIAKYAKAGWNIRLVCATNGDKGESGAFSWATGDALAGLRQEELARAGKILEIESIQLLGYPEGELSSLTPGTLEDRIYRIMAEFHPDVIMTFHIHGFDNNPNHIKVCCATTYAFQKYTDDMIIIQQPDFFKRGRGKRQKEALYRETFGESGNMKGEPKLYYAALPQTVATYLRKVKIFPDETFGKPFDGTDDESITTVIDITRTRSAKIRALGCHQSQEKNIGGVLSFPGNPLLTHEYFVLRMHGITEIYMGKTDRISNAL